ncbi:MAG TPA: hypothetical protein VN456_00305 [Desulfosporosinus sp.]|nr:hypothetical protein [Desulfosporosinus sp.]
MSKIVLGLKDGITIKETVEGFVLAGKYRNPFPSLRIAGNISWHTSPQSVFLTFLHYIIRHLRSMA